MPVAQHLLIALSYLAAAVAAGFVLPNLLGGGPLWAGLAVGGPVLVGAALTHLAMLQAGRNQALAAALRRLEGEVERFEGEVAGTREQAVQIREAVQGIAADRRGQAASLDEVMTEVRMLQDLVEQLSSGAAVAPRVRVGEVPVSAPAPMPSATSAPAATPPGAAPGATRPVVLVRKIISGLDEGRLLEIVRDGLRDNRVDLYLQPIVSLPQRKRRFYECFSRIRADEATMIVPDQYLPVAERAGLIGAIDNMLLFRCIQLLRRIQKQDTNLGIFVNISRHTLADTRFFRDFVAIMARKQELTPQLIFEFGQRDIMSHGEAVLLELERLARLGFRFSMDQVDHLDIDCDLLSRRHVRFIKVEAARLLESLDHAEGRSQMDAFKRALDRAGIDLIVEKIEDEQTLVELLDFNIDFGQGYLFGEPRLSREQ